MEELQSTEILEQEILEDARKKAFRILKAADDTVKTNSAEWEKKTTEALAELEKKFADQGVFAVDEIMAVLPMDKRRAKSERVEGLLVSAVETWYAGLSRERILGFLKKELAKRLAKCGEWGKCRAVIHKITRAEAESILKDLSISCQIEEAQSSAAYPEFVLENNDIRIYASVGKTVDFFLHEKRSELIEALLGKAALQDGEGSLC